MGSDRTSSAACDVTSCSSRARVAASSRVSRSNSGPALLVYMSIVPVSPSTRRRPSLDQSCQKWRTGSLGSSQRPRSTLADRTSMSRPPARTARRSVSPPSRCGRSVMSPSGAASRGTSHDGSTMGSPRRCAVEEAACWHNPQRAFVVATLCDEPTPLKHPKVVDLVRALELARDFAARECLDVWAVIQRYLLLATRHLRDHGRRHPQVHRQGLRTPPSLGEPVMQGLHARDINPRILKINNHRSVLRITPWLSNRGHANGP